MKYAFRWRERAVRQLRAVPQPTALTILRALTPLGDDPRRPDADIKKIRDDTEPAQKKLDDARTRLTEVEGSWPTSPVKDRETRVLTGRIAQTEL